MSLGNEINLETICDNSDIQTENECNDLDLSSSGAKNISDDDTSLSDSSDVESEQTSTDDTDGDSDESRSTGSGLGRRFRSFAIPEGLPMDPLAPAVLAVSTEFMGHLESGLTILRDHSKKVQKLVWKKKTFDLLKKSWKAIVNVVLVEAKDLPDGPDGSNNSLYCKFKLGTECHKSKRVPKSKAVWCQRFNLYLYDESNLEVMVWHKGKEKNFMGRCIIDLATLEKERTHDVWQELDCGYGRLHMLITLNSARRLSVDHVLTSVSSVKHTPPLEDKFTWYRLDNDWSEVGQLSVTVHEARGLSPLGLGTKADAYCVLELDNSRVQTHTAKGTCDPIWNKSFTFGVNDITSTLDVTVFDESILTSMKGETLGKISIPLLRINNEEKKWYALKDRSKKSSAKGNCPRILLEMSLVWNPIKASLRLMSPKERKYMQKPPKFDIPLIYNNLKFVADIFNIIQRGHEYLKRVFEWNNRERSTLALITWLSFWYFFRPWLAPLLLLIPFIYHLPTRRNHGINALVALDQSEEESEDDSDSNKEEKTVRTRLSGLQDLTFTIKNGVDFIVSIIERINNLMNFKVPYLSYLTMIVLVAAAVALYIFPINYLLMALGIYKYTRKYLNPNRTPNNDILDFLSRVPDNEILKEWRELKVPEPDPNRTSEPSQCRTVNTLSNHN